MTEIIRGTLTPCILEKQSAERRYFARYIRFRNWID